MDKTLGHVTISMNANSNRTFMLACTVDHNIHISSLYLHKLSPNNNLQFHLSLSITQNGTAIWQQKQMRPTQPTVEMGQISCLEFPMSCHIQKGSFVINVTRTCQILRRVIGGPTVQLQHSNGINGANFNGKFVSISMDPETELPIWAFKCKLA